MLCSRRLQSQTVSLLLISAVASDMLPPIAMSIGTTEQFEEQRIDLVRDQVDALGRMGFPEIQIRKTLSKLSWSA